jgi:hypothetical protein
MRRFPSASSAAKGMRSMGDSEIEHYKEMAERCERRAVDPREALRLSIRVRSVRPLFKAAAVICATNSVCELARKLLAS